MVATLLSRLRWLVIVLVTTLPAGPSSALTILDMPAPRATAAPVSVAVPEIAASRLEWRPGAPHIVEVSLSRRSPAAGKAGMIDPAQLLWLTVLLTSACAFALYLGRELTIRLPAEERELARRG